MQAKNRWKPYNSNPAHSRVGDCTIRALSKALNREWEQVYAGLTGEHYVRGHYSRDDGYSLDGRGNHYDRYMDSKQSYRSSKTPECKERLMRTLEDYMDDFSNQMEEMLRDSDCVEERTTIRRYLDKLKNIT